MEIIEKFLTPNKFSRPMVKLDEVKAVVIHWVANANSSAESNWKFFEDRKKGLTGYGSAQFIIGIKGEIIQTMPLDEKAYAVGLGGFEPKPLFLGKFDRKPNAYTINIECCHIDNAGKMSVKTYNSLVELTKFLVNKYKLSKESILLHGDITTKICHKWFMMNPEEWSLFKDKVMK